MTAVAAMLCGMATLKEKITAEHKVRELLARDRVPPPDRVEYGHTCIRLLWNEPMVALVVDIDELVDDDGTLGEIETFPRET